jgi:hypothetical protein
VRAVPRTCRPVCSKSPPFKWRIRTDVGTYRFGHSASDMIKPFPGQGSTSAPGFQKDESLFIQGRQGFMHVCLRNVGKAIRYLIDRHRPRRPDMNPLVCQQVQTNAVEIAEFHRIFFRNHSIKPNDPGKRCQMQGGIDRLLDIKAIRAAACKFKQLSRHGFSRLRSERHPGIRSPLNPL